MKEFTKGVIITLAGALICREFYARGYNNALKFVNKMADVREECLKSVKKES